MKTIVMLTVAALAMACEELTPVTLPEATGTTPVMRSSKRREVTLPPGEVLMESSMSYNHASKVLSVTARRADGSVVVYSAEPYGQLVERLILHEH
jgi:hypothetical protein